MATAKLTTKARRTRSSAKRASDIEKSTAAPAKLTLKAAVETERRRLLGADAVIMCCRHALDSQTGGLDELRVMDALQIASELLNNAVEALDSVSLRSRPADE